MSDLPQIIFFALLFIFLVVVIGGVIWDYRQQVEHEDRMADIKRIFNIDDDAS